jgi:hypothetical protein
MVHAVDVRTARRLWIYEPKVPREIGNKGSCDVMTERRGRSAPSTSAFIRRTSG